MAPGALPHPGRVPKQRLLSPKIRQRRQHSCGTLLEISPIPLGFFVPRLYIGKEAVSGGDQGGLTMGGAARAWAAPPVVWAASGPPPALFRSSTLPGIIRILELILSNSENISCVAFLKHKNSRK
jgi:hypothetical protein